MQKKARLLVTLLVLGLAAAWWWWPHSQKVAEQSAGKAPPAQTVSVVTVTKRDVPKRLQASGAVVALASVDVRAQTTATVQSVGVKDGQQVRKGQTLFELDARADAARLAQAQAQLQRSRAALADAQAQLKRAQELRAQNFVAQSALDTAQANADSQASAVRADQASLQAAQVALSYNHIRAPLSGRIGAISVVAGSLVTANATAAPLLNIAQLDPIGISFTLPEAELPALQAALQNGAGRVEASRPGDDTVFVGRLSFVDNLVDASTGSIKVRAELANPKQSLWPGQYLRVQLTLATLKDAIVIPQSAIIQRGQARQVYVVDAQQQAQALPVTLVYPFGEMAVVQGLQGGEQVVVVGKQNLRPGTPLKLEAAGRAAAPASSASGS